MVTMVTNIPKIDSPRSPEVSSMEVMELTGPFVVDTFDEGVVYPVDTPRDEMNMLVSPYIFASLS
jgi:hypothetical protein